MPEFFLMDNPTKPEIGFIWLGCNYYFAQN